MRWRESWYACGGNGPVELDWKGERVEVYHDGGYREVVLARPERHNALDELMRDELVLSLRSVLLDPDAGAVGFIGRGPSFCSGGDLAGFGTTRDPAEGHLVRAARHLPWLVWQLADRLVTGVHGACIGAGLELAAYSGRVIAGVDARFRLPEVQMGLLPGSGGTVSVPRRAGRQRSLWLMITGETIDAETALEWGLVDELVGKTEVADRVRMVARELLV